MHLRSTLARLSRRAPYPRGAIPVDGRVNHPAGEERPGAARAFGAHAVEFALIVLAPEGTGDLDSSSRGSEGCQSGRHVAGMTENSSPADPFETVAEEGGK